MQKWKIDFYSRNPKTKATLKFKFQTQNSKTHLAKHLARPEIIMSKMIPRIPNCHKTLTFRGLGATKRNSAKRK